MEKTPYSFGSRCLKWALYTFGSTLVYNSQERCARFLEEALELVQALGFNKRRALALVEYVYGREPGEVDQEFGGVMNTLYLLGETEGRNLHELGERELSRCWDNVEKIREKNLLKNKDYLNDTIRGIPVEQPTDPGSLTLVEAEGHWGDFIKSGIIEADKAMRKYPQPNYVISKIAEESGEVVKAAIHAAEGRETLENVRAEMLQLIAMLYRLWIEGDQVHGLPPVSAANARVKGGE